MTISSNTTPEALEPHQQRAKTLILAARQGLQAAGMTFVAMPSVPHTIAVEIRCGRM